MYKLYRGLKNLPGYIGNVSSFIWIYDTYYLTDAWKHRSRAVMRSAAGVFGSPNRGNKDFSFAVGPLIDVAFHCCRFCWGVVCEFCFLYFFECESICWWDWDSQLVQFSILRTCILVSGAETLVLLLTNLASLETIATITQKQQITFCFLGILDTHPSTICECFCSLFYAGFPNHRCGWFFLFRKLL